jgi:hypothetical protein
MEWEMTETGLNLSERVSVGRKKDRFDEQWVCGQS